MNLFHSPAAFLSSCLLLTAATLGADTSTMGPEFPMRVKLGARMTTLPGLDDTPQSVAQKELFNQLAFKVLTEPEQPEAHAYLDANGNGELTPDELRGLLNSPAMEGHWPEGKREELAAMIDPQNPSPLVAMNKTAEPALHVMNMLPRIVPEDGDGKFALSAKFSFATASVHKVPTSEAMGNRYVSSDMNGDGIVSLGEIKKLSQHPKIQNALSKSGKYQMQIYAAAYCGYTTRERYGKMMVSLRAKGDVFPEELRTELDSVWERCLHDDSQNTKMVFSVGKFEKLNAGSIQKPMPDPTTLEKYWEQERGFWGLDRDALQSGYSVPAPAQNLASLKVVSEKPLLSPVEGENIERFMARVEYQTATVIPVGSKFVDFDNDGNSVLEHQEVYDNLNSIFRGTRLGNYLPESTKTLLMTAANNQQIKPASLERLIEIMRTAVFEVKSNIGNTELLKMLDVDVNGRVTIGELKYKQFQAEKLNQSPMLQSRK